MKSVIAIKKFMEKDGGRKVNTAEMVEFKHSCDPADFEKMGKDAAAEIGEPWEPATVLPQQ